MSDYDDIHRNESTPIKVGVDLPALTAACTASDSKKDRHPSGTISPDALELGLVAWKLYWDDATSAYNLYEPKVALPDGSSITATGGTGLSSAGTYYCKVEKSGSTYTASVVTTTATTANTVALVPICAITANGADQYHTGVITIYEGGKTSLTGETASSQQVSGDVTITGTLASGDNQTSCGIEFETIPSSTVEGVTTPAKVVAKIKGRDATEENWGAKQLKFKCGAINRYMHVLACQDMEIEIGKTIKSVQLTPSSASGGFNEIVWTYTDDTTTTVRIQNGLDGAPGAPGEDGETPEITAAPIGSGRTAIYADGEQIAVINDGVTPTITSQKSGKVTSIFCNGVLIATINDGNDGTITDPVTEQEFITDINFSMSGNNIVATVTKKKGKMIALADVASVTRTVVTGSAVEVVGESTYSTDTRKFVNKKKSVVVISSANAADEDVFTATPLQT